MNTSLRYWTTLGQLRLPVRAGLFVASILVASLLAAAVGHLLGAPLALPMALAAGGVCILGGGISLVFSDLLRGPQLFLPAMLAGMVFRMGVPLLALVVIVIQDGPLMQAGLPFYLAAIYPLALGLETTMSLAQLHADRMTHEGR